MANFQKITSNISQLTIKNPKTKHDLKWLNVINAGRREIEYLRRNYGFNLKHLQASIATVFSQRPMISQEDGYLFLILHFPIMIHGRVLAGEIEFFIGHGYLITVHNNNISALRDFFALSKKTPDTLLAYNSESSIILLYELLDKLIRSCYLLIDNASLTINNTESLIFNEHQKEAVTQIMTLRHNVINLRKILQNHEYILRKLTEVESSLVPKKDIDVHYNKLVEHSKRIWSLLDNQKEMIEVLNDTNQSLLNNQMTSVMKTLTVFSVIIFPLTLFATLFSMRTPGMPLLTEPNAFWFVIGGMLTLGLLMFLFFKKRRWL